jgi:hypothetical protein
MAHGNHHLNRHALGPPSGKMGGLTTSILPGFKKGDASKLKHFLINQAVRIGPCDVERYLQNVLANIDRKSTAGLEGSQVEGIVLTMRSARRPGYVDLYSSTVV